MKILLVASWYPHKKNPFLGNFFRERAQILKENGFDYLVVKPDYLYVNIFNLVFRWIKFLLNPSTIIDNKTLVQDPLALTINFPVYGRIPAFITNKMIGFALKKVKPVIFKEWKPDLIHGLSFPNGAIYAELFSNVLGIPYVIVEHNTFLPHRIDHAEGKRVLQAYKNAKSIGVVSEHQKRMVLMHVPSCEPITLWNAVNEQVYNINTHKPEIFTVATVTYPDPIKDYRTFLKSMLELSKMTKDFRYIMIGNDSFSDISKANTSKFENYAKELGVWHLGTFLPKVDKEMMPEFYNNISVFASTSIAETYGNAAREAMMSGVPVVTTACGGIEDSITADTGVVVPLRNPHQMALAIFDIMNQKYCYEPEKIREYAINNFGCEVYVKRMKKFYTDAVL
ncbi:glycosyltransferase [Hymenobacter sp. BT730]|uniref:glycosyltransferase n=1 Tax=Hymenobacter sp. BT730 TaxID=3063332 RepID=UPI0026DF1172|nr:glycosyltransferase [Hymenobacter sp. BT730]